MVPVPGAWLEGDGGPILTKPSDPPLLQRRTGVDKLGEGTSHQHVRTHCSLKGRTHSAFLPKISSLIAKGVFPCSPERLGECQRRQWHWKLDKSLKRLGFIPSLHYITTACCTKWFETMNNNNNYLKINIALFHPNTTPSATGLFTEQIVKTTGWMSHGWMRFYLGGVTVHWCALVPDLNVSEASPSVGGTQTHPYATCICHKIAQNVMKNADSLIFCRNESAYFSSCYLSKCIVVDL